VASGGLDTRVYTDITQFCSSGQADWKGIHVTGVFTSISNSSFNPALKDVRSEFMKAASCSGDSHSIYDHIFSDCLDWGSIMTTFNVSRSVRHSNQSVDLPIAQTKRCGFST